MSKIVVTPGVNDLQTTHPHLAAQWHPYLNGDLTPQDVYAGAHTRVWWSSHGHYWTATLASRSRSGAKCGVCSNRFLNPGINDLATLNPRLTLWWDYEANFPLIPEQVIGGKSNKRYHWVCPICHYKHENTVASRMAANTCAGCAGQVTIPGFNDLATTHPLLAQEWDYERNFPLLPTQVTAGHSKKVFWTSHTHRWEATPNYRSNRDSGCSICSGRQVQIGFNDLATTHPDLAAEWDYERNNPLLPTQITHRYYEKVWWISHGHRWPSSVYNRANGAGCAVCAGMYLNPGVNDLATLNPALALEWDYEANFPLLPEQVVGGSSGKTYGWKCYVCNYKWPAKVSNRVSLSTGCPACSGRVPYTNINDLATTHPHLASQWHPTKNDKTPQEVSAGSGYDAWWFHDNHEWHSVVKDRVRGQGCAVCANRQVQLGVNDLATTHPHLVKEWHPTHNGDKTPYNITAGHDKPVWWLCNEKHTWDALVYNRTGTHASGCRICANKAVLVGFNDLATTHPHLVDEWGANNTKTPYDVTYGSGYPAEWVCSAGHTWVVSVSERASAGYGCKHCASNGTSRPEQELSDFLTYLNVPHTMNDRTILSGKELDIFIPSHNLAIEYNGLYWHSEDAGKGPRYHSDKTQACAQAGVRLIHIWEDEWLEKRPIVERLIKNALGLTTGRTVFARKTHAVSITYEAASRFLNTYHIQGKAVGSAYYGLVTDTNELVAVMVLKRSGSKYPGQWTLDRYATACSVPGGHSKLLKHFQRNNTWTSIVTFADLTISEGSLYETTGWTRDSELDPDYRYVYRNQREHKFNFRRARFRDDPAFQYDPDLTEKQLAQMNGLPRVYDCGKIRYVMTNGDIIE